ncbi:hypothetical protein SERLA73DRAFT_161551 [Serpula lacrymans var. lacrymans S7.3]|uniref:Uncharacterized protein n=2 Tax=Serpula lacrymans var. lacrymans TaxID=341189 RepID=F8Q307_SERL3|nr:uncharacterized protein SERLADRAFT_416603 [Serpula lacrymans var. lacrymans S7.9]EGN97568.1 hypothetical protein SERLA73DRAFT_161551 [Serpula lacrymans var. lacrymans S7.3]EGO23164.1 hypothetical protein SERLADRAFT_416603 [Serpula lacrymans var. lacrymans S7.9]
MSYRGSDNLLAYIKDAVLPALVYSPSAPELPPVGHKSHRNTISCRHNSHRQIHVIHVLSSYNDLVNGWTEKYIPCKSLGVDDYDGETEGVLSVPSARRFAIPYISLKPVSNTSLLEYWLYAYPLRTVQRVLHLAFPQISRWGFDLGNRESDDIDDIFRNTVWTHLYDASSAEISRKSVILICQPPWVLSPEDMLQFIEMKSLPTQSASYQSKERLWARIWDICTSKRSPYFILTSYQKWIFGSFSRGWTAAFVSPVYDSSSHNPTIIQALVYWLASAADLPEGFIHPDCPEPVMNMTPQFAASDAGSDASSIAFAWSESRWSGQSQEPGSSAGFNTLVPDISDNEGSVVGRIQGPLHMMPIQPLWKSRAKVEEWRSKLLPVENTPPRLSMDESNQAGFSEPVPEYAGSEASTESDETIIDMPVGHWLASGCRAASVDQRHKWVSVSSPRPSGAKSTVTRHTLTVFGYV